MQLDGKERGAVSLAEICRHIRPLRWLARATLRGLIYRGRVDSQGNPLPLRPVIGRLNQFCMERGWTAPYIRTKEECQRYWASRTESSEDNTPLKYAAKDTSVMDFLAGFWSPDVDKSHSVLELGCNCGVNLECLRKQGHSQLSGVEISPAAVGLLKRTFPDLHVQSTIHLGSLEEVLPRLPTGSVDVVFTMTVAMHIHPASNFLFKEMVRIAKRYLCTVEPEVADDAYAFTRQYQRVFEKLGPRQIRSVVLDRSSIPGVSPTYYGCAVRLFDASTKKFARNA